MNTITIIISAITAFVITAGGALAIAFLAVHGAMPDLPVWISAVVLGFVAAAKDTRSLLKLPPVNNQNQNP